MSSPALHRSGIPLYVQIASAIRRRISTGLWAAGEQVPTLEALAKEFKVARLTVRQAMEQLAQEGLVSRHRGKGSFVLRRPLERPWLTLHTEIEALTQVEEDTEIRHLADMPSLRGPTLSPEEGRAAQRYQYLRRVHSRAGMPYAVLDLHIDRRVYRHFPAEKWRKSTVIPLLLKVPGVGIARAHQTITIGSADLETAELLRLPLNAPIAEVRRLMIAASGVVVYYGELHYRGDLVRLDIELF